jgi:hypothetical protein
MTYINVSHQISPQFLPLSLSLSLRWSALTAYDILTEYKTEYLRVVEAFREGLPLEECIAAIEGEGEVKLLSNQ